MELREYCESDIKGILRLHYEFEQEFFSEPHIDHIREHGESNLDDVNRYYLAKGKKFWVIEYKGEIIGFVGIRLIEDEMAELIRMRVKKGYRGQGLGKKLLLTVEEYCRKINIKRIILHTAKRLTVARKMYENHGFKLYDERVVHTAVQFIMMSYYKDLTYK